MAQCLQDGCSNDARVRGMCQMHYQRWRRHGDATVVKPRGSAKRYEWITRPCDYCGENPVRLKAVEQGKPHYCSRDCSNKADKPMRNRRGAEHPNWRGGHVNREGYRQVWVRQPDGSRKLRLEHRVVMEQVIGRPLLPHETVHHGPKGKAVNTPDNLELWSSRHPKGQRVDDLVAFAREILGLYGDLVPR